MKSLGHDVGTSAYRQLYLESNSGINPVPAKGRGWKWEKVVTRFESQGIVHRHNEKLYLRALPAKASHLGYEDHRKVRVGLATSCWGLMSRKALSEAAAVDRNALSGYSDLWNFSLLEASLHGPRVPDARVLIQMLAAKAGSEHISEDKIEKAIADKGPAYWTFWYHNWDEFCAQQDVKEQSAYLYRLVVNSQDRLPFACTVDTAVPVAIPTETAPLHATETAPSATETAGNATETAPSATETAGNATETAAFAPPLPYKGNKGINRINRKHGALRAPAHVREADGDAMLHAFYQSLKTWLVETVKVDDVGVRAKIRDCKNPETVQQKCRWFGRWLDATIEELPGNIFRFKDTGQTVANIEGFILKALFATWESPGIDDQIDIFMTQHFDLYEGHPPLPWEQWIPISHDTELQQISRPADPDPDPVPPAALPVIVDTPCESVPEAPEVGTEAETLMRLKEIGMGTLPDDFVAAQMSDKYAMQYRRQGIHWTAAHVKHYRERDVQNHTSETGTVQELPI